MSDKRTLKVKDRLWTCGKDLPEHALWHSGWYCSDGDGAELFIEKDNSGFTLECFSGIPASSIYLDEVDFGVFWKKAGLSEINNPIDFELKCVMIADYLCGLFCEWKDY